MHPVLFSTDLFGLLSKPWSLHVYGLMIATGFLVAISLAKRQAGREGEDPEAFVDLGFYLLLWGLIGARVVFIFTKLDDYLHNPIDIFLFWRGGLVFYGGFLGAALYLVYFCKRHRMDYFKVVDILVPYLALAHVFGRFGCLAAGCCYGKPSELPWAIVFPSGSMAHSGQQSDGLVGFDVAALPVHPTQLYEAGAELLLFAFLVWLRPRKHFHGHIFLSWVGVYAVVRSFIELFRGDKERGVYLLSTSQYISAVIAVIAIGLYFYIRKKRGTGLPATASA